MVTLNSYPRKVLPVGTEYCYWNGVFAPAVWEFYRRDLSYIELARAYDYGVTGTWEDKLFVRVPWSTLGLSPSDPEVLAMVGNKIRLVTSANYTGAYTVLSIWGSTGMVLDVDWTVDEVFGFLNSDSFRESHRIEIELYHKKDSVYTLIDDSIRIKANKDGVARFNPSQWLKNLLTKSTHDYSVSKRDLALGGAYGIKYRESYIGSSNSFSSIGKTCYYTGFAPNLLESNNQKLYFMGNGQLGKFLSGFDQPTYFKGYPFDLQWIFDETMNDVEIFRVNRDANNLIDSYSDLMDGSQFEGVFRMNLRDKDWASMQVYLNSGDPVDPPIYIERSYIESDYIR